MRTSFQGLGGVFVYKVLHWNVAITKDAFIRTTQKKNVHLTWICICAQARTDKNPPCAASHERAQLVHLQVNEPANVSASQHAHINVKGLSSTRKVNLHLLAVVERQEQWLHYLWAQSEQWQKNNKKNRTLNDTLLHFTMVPDNPLMLISILDFLLTLPNSVVWLMLMWVIVNIPVGVFNVTAVKSSSVNRQPSTICFFMIPGLIV